MADYVVALSAWLDPHLLLLLLDSCPASTDLFQAQVKVVGATRLFTRMEQMQQSGAVFPLYAEKSATTSEIQQLQSDISTSSADHKAIHRLAKLLYDTGDYLAALNTLKDLSRQGDKDLWGLLHASITSHKFDDASKYLTELSDSALTSEQRVWLVHLSLFLAFPEHPSTILDAVSDEIEGLISACPHLARYIVVGLLLTQDYKTISGFVRGLGSSSEPLVAIVVKTVVEFDFRGAMGQFREVMKEVKGDFFLAKVEEQLGVTIQRFVIETYLRVHSRLSMEELSSYIGLSVDETELWAANLIRNARMEATISDNSIQILRCSHSLYSQIIEKTKEAYFRSKVLLSNVKSN